MKSMCSILALSAMCLFAADTTNSRPLQEQLMEIAKEARKLRANAGETTDGELTDLIERCEKIPPGPDATDQERLMKLAILAELQSLNGQYVLSNKSYAKAFAINPNFDFYRKMVVNMRRKGDAAAAAALVEKYRRILLVQYPGDDQELRRQDLLQFVASALTSELPRR